MKKNLIQTIIIFSIVLAVAGTAIAGLVVISEEKTKGTEFVVATDTHVVATSLFTADNYNDYAEEDKLMHLSETIFNSFVDQISDTNCKFLLLCGDLSEAGDLESHRAVAAALTRLEKTGVKVFLINGNHDVAGSLAAIGKRATQEQFKEIYNDFGYSEAIAVCEGTLSYVADADEKYRIIAVDDIGYYTTTESNSYKESISSEHSVWICDQIDACKRDGKTPIIITHKPFLTHMPKATNLVGDKDLRTSCNFLSMYMAKKGANYIFAGHEHITDISDKKLTADEKEYTVYEISTGSMAYIGVPYRKVTFGEDEVTIETKCVDELNDKYYSQYVPDETRQEIKQKGLVAYAKDFVYRNIYSVVSGIADEGGILDISVPEGVTEAFNLIKSDVISKIMTAPYYIKDEMEGGVVSLERVLAAYEIVLPQSKYKNVSDLAANCVINLANGGENYRVTQVELVLIKYTVMWVFDYLDSLAGQMKEIYPSYPEVDFDLKRMYTKGELECYQSNVVPFVSAVACDFINELMEPGMLRNMVTNMVGGALATNLDAVHNVFILSTINGFTDGLFDGFEQYFYSYYIDLAGFIDDGMFGNYISDFVVDKEPSDLLLKIRYDTLNVMPEE